MAQIEHLGERISEKVLKAQAQPGQRGYIQGTHQRAGMAVGKNAFGVKTLVGNWYEEQCDVRHHPGRPLLITDQEKLWRSEQMRTISKPKWDVQLRNDEHILKANQTTHLELSDRKNNPIFPGHKAPASAKFTQGPERAWETEQRSSFTNPKGRKFIFRKFVSGLGRQADDKPWNDRLEEIRTTWTKSTPLTLQRINETENRRAFQDWSSSIRAQQQEGKFTTRTQTAA